ncbi:hypothetical protein PV10_03970 [Exophiala mesophila]|uniref:Chromosome transmission fidelity protein 4 n=1 Tax=Exophiala mesophila TaxID=212818 RepID=A0A0D2A0U2_EXOME|nr:uncharacterized protein PV10_03970 [Exophiala mesophila]KIV92698.1 hypothetical protein PV10_03970 [Exophiala mesophila]
MTFRPMRKLPPTTTAAGFPARCGLVNRQITGNFVQQRHRATSASSNIYPRQVLTKRHLAQVRPEPISELWFTSSSPRLGPADDLLGNTEGPVGNGNNDHKPPDERLIKLGKTLRTLSPLLPNILTSPLPQEILSPAISLHLFPSTHPHLPAVKGRVAYRAALWTAPVAWGCVPIVGNVKLQILSEKIVRTGYAYAVPAEAVDESDLSEEKLVVRWKTEPKASGNGTGPQPPSESTASARSSSSTTQINSGLSKLLGGDSPILNINKSDSFSGLFIFTFDSRGRIASHTIEHADESNGFDKTNKVVTLTDWLLGKARWGNKEKDQDLVPGLAMRVCREEWNISRGLSRKGGECGQ